MSFSDNIKQEVKKMALFRCSWCQSPDGSLDVHHIIPESEDGPSTIDNAAPLCKKCHDTFGTNPSKRVEILKRRDCWYEHCKHMSVDPETFQKLLEEMSAIKKGQISREELKEDIKKIGSEVVSILVEKFEDIRQKASSGGYPNWGSFKNDMVTASGTAAAAVETNFWSSPYTSIFETGSCYVTPHM